MASESRRHYSKIEKGVSYAPAPLPARRPLPPASDDLKVFTGSNETFSGPGSRNQIEFRGYYAQKIWDSTSIETRIGSIDRESADHTVRGERHVISKLTDTLSFIFGILWLGPAIALIYLNATGYVIGASAWCPQGTCRVMNYYAGSNHSYAQNAVEADNNDRMAVRTIQFTAKVMEVWFCFIAVGLVYLVSSILARRREGIPLGYLLTHLEFVDLRILFSSSLWKPVKYSRYSSASDGAPRRPGIHLYLFVFLVAFMSLITNFMGPSIAMLMIPSLDWIVSETHGAKSFRQGGSHLDSVFLDCDPTQLPQHLIIPNCEVEALREGHISCTFGAYGGIWDSLASISVGIAQQRFSMEREQATLTKIYENNMLTPSMEYEIPFSFNITSYDQGTNYSESAWAPNRQVLREIATEFESVYSAIRGGSEDSPYVEFNNSLKLVLERDGPLLGMDSVSLYAEGRDIRMDDDPEKVVACTLGYAYLGENEIWSKCYQVGLSWSKFNTSSFYFRHINDTNIRVNFHWVEKMAYFRGDKATDLPACLRSNEPSSTDCIWEDILVQPTSEDLPEQLKVRARPTLLSRYYYVQAENNERPISDHTLYAITEYFPYMQVATYTLNITNVYPSRSQVEISSAPNPETIKPLVFHPNWMLAVWSVDTHDFFSEDPRAIDLAAPDRSPTSIITGAIYDRQNFDETRVMSVSRNPNLASTFYNVALFSGLQALSMVPYNTTAQAVEDDASQQARYPVMNVWFRRQVWKFGLGSSTSRLGLVVVSFGMLSVLARSILFFVACDTPYSTASLVASALRHSPNREFDDLESDSQYARMRFMVHNKNGTGQMTFRKTR